MTIRLPVAGIIGSLLLPLAAAAQQPTRPAARLVATTRNEAVKPALERALVEVANYGGARADAQLQGLLRADPEAGFIRALLASGSTNITAATRTRELDRAVQDAAKASTPELLVVTAMREYRAGRTAASMTLLEAAAKLLPDEPLVALFMANTAADPEEKLRLAEAGHEKFPDYAGLHNTLAYAQYEGGFPKEALATAKAYTELLPDHPNSHDTYAELLHREGDLDAAERGYRRALDIDPTFYGARIGLAEVALSRGNLRTTRTEIEAALANAPKPINHMVMLNRAGWAAALNRDIGSARRYMNEAIEAAEAIGEVPAFARNTRMQLALAEAALDNRREAEAAFEAATAMPGDGSYDGLMQASIGALVKDRDAMQAGLAAVERAAAANGAPAMLQEAVHLTRAINASATGQIDVARAELALVKTPAWHVIGQGYLARGLKNGNDRAGAAQARQGLEKYLVFDASRAFAVLISR